MTISLLATSATRGGALLKCASLCLKFLPEFPPVPGARLRCLFLTVVGMVPMCQAAAVSSAVLAWDPNPETDIAGYRLSYGISSGVYDHEEVVLNATEVPVQGLVEGNTYYFAVAAFNQSGQTGPISDEISYFVEPKTPTNHAPSATTTSVATDEDTPLPITLQGADSDGDSISYLLMDRPAHGTITGTPPALIFTPAADFHGSDQITFRTSDALLDSPPATVSITVRPINDAPLAKSLNLATAENAAVNVLLSGSDVDGDAMTFSVLSQPAHGSLSGNPPNLTYLPATNFSGNDSFSYKSHDASASSTPATVSISVSFVNQAPVATSASRSTARNTALALTLTGSDRDSDPLTFIVTSQPAHGTLTGTPPNISYSPAANYHGSDQISFKVNDGKLDSAPAIVAFTVTQGNTVPTVSDRFVTTKENEALALTLNGSDVDSDPLTFTVVSAPSNGTLTGSPPNLIFTPNFEFSGLVQLVYKANDGTGSSTPATISILVTVINHAPVAASASLSTPENSSLPVTLSATDKDKNSFTFAIVSGPLRGTLAGTAPNLTYTPNSGFSGNDSFTYKANDGSLASQLATISILVTAINHAPVATAAALVTAEDTPQTIILSGTDPDKDALTFQIVSNPAHGTLTGSIPNLTYTPDADYHGPDQITFQISDGELTSAPVTVSISVTAINDLPTVADRSVTVVENQSTVIILTGEDKDGDALTFAIVSQPAHGTLSGTSPNLVYTPTNGFSGNDSFSYKANDGSLNSLPAIVSILATAINHAPVATAAALVTAEDTPQTIILSGTDPDKEALTFQIVSNPAHGTLTGSIPNFTYTPDADYHGPDQITFQVSDRGLTSAPATISINVTSVNDLPAVADQAISTVENQPTDLTLTGEDKDGDALTFVVVSPPAHGILTGTPPNLVYTPTNGFSGNDSFSYKANDGTSNSASATVSIQVTAINHAPIAMAASLVTAEDTPRTVILSGTDPDGDALSFKIVSNPAHGTLTGTVPNLTYTPDANFHGSDPLTFQVSDGELTSAPAAVSINVTAVNDLPTVADRSVTVVENQSTAVTLTAEDSDGDVLAFSVISQPAHGTLTGTPPELTYSPTQGFSGNDSFTYRAADGSASSPTATISIHVSGINHAPVAKAASLVTAEDTPLGILLTGTDMDGDSVLSRVISGPAHGTLTGTAPNLTYVPSSDFHGSDQFSFQVSDGNLDSATAVISLTVTPANDVPTVSDRLVTTKENDPLALTLSGSDVDGDPLTFIVVSAPANGTLTGTPPKLTFTPDFEFSGLVQLVYKANDGTTSSASATVSIFVTAINHAPVAAEASLATQENASVPVTLSATDRDRNAFTFAVVSGPLHGVLTGKAPNLIYTPTHGFSGNDSFTYKANDGSLDSLPATVSIQITAINHAPDAKVASLVTAEDTSKAILLTGSDSDNDSLTFQILTNPAHGTLIGTPPNLTYVPNADSHGQDLFTFQVSDGELTSPPATVSITVSSVNDVPTVASRSITVVENQSAALTLTGQDMDGDALTFTIVSQPAHGTLSGTSPSLVYTPANGFSGNDSFTYKANDGGAMSQSATVSVRVTSINHAPVAQAAELVTAEDTPLPFLPTGIDADGDSLSFTVISGPAHGTLTGVSPNFIYVPAADFHGPDAISFQVSDGSLTSAPAIVSISVSSINDAPVVADNSFLTGYERPLTIILTGEDTEDDELTFTVITPPAHGKLSGKLPDLVYTPEAGFEGDDRFFFKASDGIADSETASISIAVGGGLPLVLNLPPTFTTPGFVATATGGQAITGQLTATDPNGDDLVFSKVSGGSWLNVSADGSFQGTAQDSDVGEQTFLVRVNDPLDASATATLTVTISAANRAPVFAQSPLTCPPGTEKISYWKQSLASTATDLDIGDRLTFSKVSGPDWLSISDDGSLHGKPGSNSAGVNRFTIRVTDNHGAFTDSELEIPVVANRLPLPWKLNRLGDGFFSDPATYRSGTFTMGGSGALNKTQDAANFGWQKLSGNGTITARVRKLDDTGKDTRVGLMIRQSLAPDACQAVVGLDGNGKLHWLRRAKYSGAAKDLSRVGSRSDNSWLRLKRKGNTIYAYRSKDGRKWEKIASGTLKLPKNCYVGLSVSSGDDNVLNTSRFSNVRVKP